MKEHDMIPQQHYARIHGALATLDLAVSRLPEDHLLEAGGAAISGRMPHALHRELFDVGLAIALERLAVSAIERGLVDGQDRSEPEAGTHLADTSLYPHYPLKIVDIDKNFVFPESAGSLQVAVGARYSVHIDYEVRVIEVLGIHLARIGELEVSVRVISTRESDAYHRFRFRHVGGSDV